MKQRDEPPGPADSAPSRGLLPRLMVALSLILPFGMTGLAAPAHLAGIPLEDPLPGPVEETDPVVSANRVPSHSGPSGQRHRSRWSRTLPGHPQTSSAREQRLSRLGSVPTEHIALSNAPAPRLC